MLETSLFSGPYVSQTILSAHGRYVNRTGDEFLADPCDVRDRAEKYVRRVTRTREGAAPGHELVAGTYAGLMAYAVERYGFDYLFIARLSTKTTADVVAAISADGRLDLGPRRHEIQTRVSRWSPIAQAASLAEIVETGLRLRSLATPEWLRRPTRWGNHNHYELAAWADHAAILLAGMAEGLFANERLRRTREKAENLICDLHGRTRSRKLARDRREAAAAAFELEAVAADSGMEEHAIP